MEKALKIPTSDNKNIYGILRGEAAKPLIIFIHGLIGDKNQHIFYNGARFFESKEISSFRFNLYEGSKDARKLDECSISTHAKDLDTVIKYFRKMGVKKIFVVGHSLGGPAIMLSSDKDFQGVVLWDPAYGVSKLFQDAKFISELNSFVSGWGFDFIISKEMVEERDRLDYEQLISGLNTPLKIISAGKGILLKAGRRYLEAANEPKELVVIKNADHNFDNDGNEEDLFQETHTWIKKYS